MLDVRVFKVDVCRVFLNADGMNIYDDSGKVIATQPPKTLTGEFCRKAYMYGMVEHPVTLELEEKLVRHQLPHVVTLLIYDSKLQLTPTRREYYVYAPGDFKSAVTLAIMLWKRWERGPKPFDVEYRGEEWYPKFEDAVVAEVIDDKCFEEQWRAASSRKFKAAGHPNDPFAFTCLDQDVMLFKTSDFQQGLQVRI
jgi:hypothetical protein